MNLIIYSLLSFLTNSFAATFLPIEIVERMKNSDAAVFGEYNGQTYKRLSNGQVVTEYSIKVEKFTGLRPNELISKNNYKVIVPGGVWNNEVHKISGTPKFRIGEKIVLMVKKGPYGYTLPDLSMSKFKVVRKNNQLILKSDIFTDTYNVGRISLKEFNGFAEAIYGKELTAYNSDKFIYKKIDKDKKSGRHIASYSDEVSTNKSNSFSFVWLTLTFALLGFIGSVIAKGRKD